MIDHKRLGEAISHERKLQRMTACELARKAGVHRNYIASIEKGIPNVTLSTLRKIFEALGYDMLISFGLKEINHDR